MSNLIPLAIFGLTIALILLRPFRLNEAIAAIGGGMVMIILGVMSPEDGMSAILGSVNVILFFLGLLILCAMAETAGFFDWSGALAVKYARHSARRLFIIVFIIGVVITTVLSNDATALLLTPVVYVLTRRLRLDPIPYVFACAFVANAASFLLPVSNPVNLLAIDRFDIHLTDYLRYLFLPGALAVLITLGLFLIIFKDSLRQTFDVDAPAFKRNPMFAPTVSVLALTVTGYIIFSLNGWPLCVPVLCGAVWLLSVGLLQRRVHLKVVSKQISWTILPFIAGLALLVQGLESSGLTQDLGHFVVNALAGSSAAVSGLMVSFSTAVGANVMNNWPAMMVAVSALSGISPAIPISFVYLSIVGASLGPNITVMGSLSTMLWLVILRRHGIDARASQYFKLGLLITPAALLAASLVVIWIS